MSDSKFKVLFVYPNFPMSHMLLPAGVAILSAVLKENDIDVRLFDTTLYLDDGKTFDEIRESLSQLKRTKVDDLVQDRSAIPINDFNKLLDNYQPDLIAISLLEDTVSMGLPYVEIAKERGIPVVAGGVYPTFNPDEILKNDAIDIVCIGEGENALVSLCKALASREPINKIKNLHVKNKDGSITRNPLGPLVNVNELPFADYDIFQAERFYRPMQGKVLRMLPVEMHRGCPYKCAFCEDPSQNLLYKNAGVAKTYHRTKSPQRLIDEIQYFVDKYEANYIYFNAETFFAMPHSDFLELAELYEKQIGLPFWLQTRPETITEQRVALLKKMNVSNINVGLEHGNETFRANVLNRRMRNEKVVDGLKILNDAEIPVTVNNIMGFPDETRELVFDTIELNRQVKTATINAYLYNPYQGTQLYDVCKEKGYLSNDDDEKFVDVALSTEKFAYFKTCLRMPTISPEELVGLQKTFVLYAKLPRSEFDRIRIAEKNDDAGIEMFAELNEQYADIIAGKVTLDEDVLGYLTD
jgi:anaerobic magnesium-protoporphyrin IX monomethyl ester cyclase